METHKFININENAPALVIESSIETVGKMVAKVAEYNFEWRYFTLLVIVASSNTAAVQVFFKNYLRGFAVATSDKIGPRSHDVSQFIIFGYNTLDVIDIVTKLAKCDYDTSGKYLIVCSSNKCDENLIFRTLAKYSIVNALFFKSVDIYPRVFFYSSIIPGNCNNDKPDMLNEVHLNCKNDDCFKQLFRLKLLNMQKCPLVVSTFDRPPMMVLNTTNSPSGSDGEMIKVVASKLNATLIIKTPAEHLNGYRIDENWTGVLGDIHNGRAHSTAYGIPLYNSNVTSDFRASYPYDFFTVAWVTAVAENLRSWELLMYPFESALRIAIVIVFAAIICLSCFMKTLTWRNIGSVVGIEPAKTKYSLLYYSWIIFIGMPIANISKKTSFRVMLCVWVWSSFVLRCSYSSALIKFLKRRNFDENISNIYDAYKNGLQFGGNVGFKFLYRDEPDIYNNWVDMNVSTSLDERNKILNGTSDFILAVDKRFFINNFGKWQGRTKLKFLKGNLITSPISLHNKKFSTITKSLNKILLHMRESGFMHYFRKRFYGFGYGKWLYNNRWQNNVVRPLTNHQLLGLYTIFLMGLIISVFAFIIELICSKCFKK